MTGARLKVGLAVTALVAVPAVAFASPTGLSGSDRSGPEQATTAAHRPRLAAVPEQARVTVGEVRGSGDSEVFEFTPASDTYTMAITCASPTGTNAELFDLGYPDDPVAISCDGIPNSWVVGGTSDTQQVQVKAGADTTWVFSIYDGDPAGVAIRSSNGMD